MSELFNTLLNLFVMIFVLASMFGLGLSLTLDQIWKPLRDVFLILKSLTANFILVPLLALLLARVFGLDQWLAAGLFVMAVVAGAPFLAKYAQIAKGDLAFAAGLMALLQVITVIYAPFVLPLFVPGAQVDQWGILQSLVLSMLLPLALGLFVRARYESLADTLNPHAAHASSLAMLGTMVLGLLLYGSELLSVLGTGAIIAALLLVAGALVLGYLLGGPERDTRMVLGLGTAQRNISASMLIAVQNFAQQPNVLLMVLVGSLVMMIINVPVAGEWGKRSKDRSGTKPVTT
jgi:BASS family bile acid:Na+ symporter